MKRLVIASLCLVLAVSGIANAQSRPLATEDPETVPAGHLLIEGGYDLLGSAVFPVSGLTGTLHRIGTFGISIGVSSIAEIQLDGGLVNRLKIKSQDPNAPLAGMLELEGDSTSDVEDLVIGAKVRFVNETDGRPAMAVRFSTRLPNAGNESGLGLDTTDFHFGFAVAKTVQALRVAGNFGFGILPDPVRGDRQNDVIELGASIARAVAQGVEIVGELNGRVNTRAGTPPAGTESRGMFRFGSRFTHGPVRFDGALVVGLTDYDPSWGITTGVTWVFKAFTVQ